jgi:exodeoxyribonuclease VII large subunit
VRQVEHAERGLQLAVDRLRRCADQLTTADQRHLDAAAARLALLDPANLLRRGWSITHTDEGTLVRSVADLAPGAELVTRLADGEVVSRVHRTAVQHTAEAEQP